MKLTKPRQVFLLTPPIQIEGSWMIGLMSLEVYNFISNKNTSNNKIELYKDIFHEISFGELKDELKEILKNSDITPYHVQHEIKPRIIQAYRKLRLEKSSTYS